MAKSIFLIRHAEAEQAGQNRKDIDRPLTSSGRRDANRLGMFMAGEKVKPDLMLTSSAVRAIQTSEIIAEQVRYDLDKIWKQEELYNAPIRVILEQVNEVPEKFSNIILIGHNPGISYFADYLTSQDLGAMDVCSMIAVDFEGNWNEVSQHTGILKMVRNKD